MQLVTACKQHMLVACLQHSGVPADKLSRTMWRVRELAAPLSVTEVSFAWCDTLACTAEDAVGNSNYLQLLPCCILELESKPQLISAGETEHDYDT